MFCGAYNKRIEMGDKVYTDDGILEWDKSQEIIYYELDKANK